MRTTLTLDDDVAARLRELAHRRGLSFKQVVNSVLRRGLGAQEGCAEGGRPFQVEVFRSRFRPGADPLKLNRVNDDLEMRRFGEVEPVFAHNEAGREERAMAANRTSFVYVGLAGETGQGRVVGSGLYRMAVGDDRWELSTRGLPEAPTIRAIAPHPEHPGTVYVGTQHGPYRSTDHGEHWERLDVPDHGSAVWSLVFDPRDSSVLYAGYENCEIFRSEDGGEHWRQLPVTVRFPEVTVGPGANPAKRVLRLAANPADPGELYAAIEVGGILRSQDGGQHWENMSHGQYLNDDTVDMHGVLVGRWRPGMVLAIGRAGLFRSTDRGEHWASARLEPLNPKGQTYCRDIREVPGDPKTIWVAAGANFQSDVGVLFRSADGGMTWARVDMGVEPRTTMFAIAFDQRQPRRMYCATSGGEVFSSEDGGHRWAARNLPEGATQVYAMACA
jgi:photosystem II stability/assembly factor-like uncharacterized protein